MPKLKDRALPKGDFPHHDENRARLDRPKPKGDDAPRGHLSGFCNDEADLRDEHPHMVKAIAVSPDVLHDRCRGGVTQDSGKFSPCICPGHDEQRYCHLCLHEFPSPEHDDYDRPKRRCADIEACAARMAARTRALIAADPLSQQIREIKEGVAERQRQAREENLAKMQLANLDPRPAVARPTSSGSARPAGRGQTKTPQKCHEGCGGTTGGGRFLPGHDMKLKGRLFELARQPLPSDERTSAADEIVARGWSEAGIDPATIILARQEDPLEVVIRAVRARYDDETLEVH